MTYTSRSFL